VHFRIIVVVLQSLFTFACCSFKSAASLTAYIQTIGHNQNVIACLASKLTKIELVSMNSTEEIVTNNVMRPVPSKIEIDYKKSKVHRSTISKENKKVLNEWLQNNIDNPYALPHDIDYLIEQTGLSEKSIRVWLNNRRGKDKNLQTSYFSLNDKIKMIRFYQDVCNHPGPKDLENLSIELGKDWKRIRSFFNSERYAEKQFLKRAKI
jgi:hypothetical protein